MIERFLQQTEFVSQEDFVRHFHIDVPEHFNFAYDVMDVWAREAPDKLAMLWTNDQGEEKRFTFRDLKEMSDQAAAYLLQLGIRRGDSVMLMLGRRYEFWVTMLALHKIGAVAIPATHLLTAHDIIYRCQRADIKAILCAGEPSILEHISEALPACPSVCEAVSIGPLVPAGFRDYASEWQQASFPAYRSRMRKEADTLFGRNENSDTMLMYFTSGTSGEPKMVAHDFTYALGHLVTGVYWHNLGEDSLHLTIADTGWGKAVWGKMYGQWFAGATVFVYDHKKFTPADLLQKMADYHITSLCAPPTIYRFLIQEDFSKYDLSSLRWACTAGEALNGAVFEKFKALTGLELREGFGQTETTMTLGTFPWMKPKPGSMGLPNPQYDIDLLLPDGTPAKPGERGEIVVRTDKGKPLGLFKGYYKDAEKTARVWHDGVYHTGDVAWRDEDGYFWFVGRNDDVIKSSGYRISPFEVESVLMQHPAVVECAVTGVPDDIRGMVVKATIVLGCKWRSQAGEDLKKDIQTFVKTHTAPYKYPRVVEFVPALPKTISGKVRRVEIREGDLRSRLEQGLRKIHEALRPVFWSTHNVEWIDNVL